MGAFRLMDLIGNDINFAVTSSLFNAFHQDSKFRPSRIQEQKVLAGHLGRKTGKGFYDYNK
jgi:3-hydroxybutyryl-CoA dehydrogenase